jgi:tetratricopeptide (TPR) repeat protein
MTRAAPAAGDHATVAAMTRLMSAEPKSAEPAPRERPAPLEPGELVQKRYRVVRMLKEGGMGVVFEAEDLEASARVALKVLRPELGSRADLVRFRHEYYLMATFSHPRLVEVKNFVVTDTGSPCLVMDYVSGVDLVDVLPLAWQEAASVLHEVASALAFLHSRRYIHHDIKPGNVRVERDRSGRLRAKLIDFGIMEPIGAARRTGIAGTPAYLPPEALLGAPTDHRLDLYSLGVMACELVTGVIPFDFEPAELFLEQKHVKPPDFRALLAATPAAFAELVSDLTAIDPAARPYDASVVLRRLRHTPGVEVATERASDAPPYLRPSRLVGREQVLTDLYRAALGTGEGPVLAIVRGQAGMGKTAVLRELWLRTRLRGGLAEEVSGRTAKGPFGVVRGLLRGVLATQGGAPEAVLEQHAPLLVRVLPELADRFPDLVPASQHPDPGEALRQLAEAARAWLSTVLGRQRVLFFVDDAELADQRSLELLRALSAASELRGLFIVVAHRSAEKSAAPSRESPLGRLASGAALDVELGELGMPQVSELLVSLFGAIELYPKFVSALAEAGRHNPSLLLEIIRRLVDEHVIQYEDERWQLPRELGEQRLPGTLAEAIGSRLSALSTEGRRVLDALVVANEPLSLELLLALTRLADKQLSSALDQLVAAELVEGREGFYGVSRFVDRSRLHASIDGETKRELHRRAGSVLERHYGSLASSHAAELAEHFLAGGPRGKALYYLAEACTELYEAQALTDALEPLSSLERLLLEDGAASAAEGSEAQRLLLVTRQRLARVGLAIDSELADRYFLLERRSFLADVPAPVRARPAVPRLLRLGRLLGPELVACARRPRRLQSLPRRLTHYFTATAYHSATLALKGSFGEALDVADTLSGFVFRDRSRAGGAYNVCRAIACVHQGRVKEAERALLLALEAFRNDDLVRTIPKTDVDSGLGGLYTGLTLLYAARGRPEAARWLSDFERFVTERERTLHFLKPNLFLSQIEYHLHRGEVRLVQEVALRYKAHHAEAGRYNAHVEMQILVGLARTALAAHNLVVAEALCAELRAQRPGDFFSHGWGACVSGELWRLQRLYDRARGSLSSALEYATRPGENSFKLELRALNALAELELEEDRPDRALEFAERALRLASAAECASEYEKLWALRTLAAVAARGPLPSSGQRHAEEMLKLADRCKNPLFSAVAEKVQAELCRTEGQDATGHVAAARVLFDSLGYLPSTVAPSHASSRDSSPIWSAAPGQSSRSDGADTAETLLAMPYRVSLDDDRDDDGTGV